MHLDPPFLTFCAEVGVLGLAAAAYLVVALAAVWVAVMIYLRNTGNFLILPRFYLCLLLFFASLIRGIYFALLGSEVIKDRYAVSTLHND